MSADRMVVMRVSMAATRITAGDPEKVHHMPVKIQLAIQGGGAKIFPLLAAAEHLQDLQRDKEIEITRIAGTSAGAIVACVLGSGIPILEIRRKIEGIGNRRWQRMFPSKLSKLALFWSVIRSKPLIDTDPLKEFLSEIFGAGFPNFEALRTRTGTDVKIVATSLITGEAEVLDEKELLIDSILHSCAVPFVFRTSSGPATSKDLPIEGGGIVTRKDLLVDGGICENLPSDILLRQPDYENMGRLVGISFRRANPDLPTSTISFGKALVDAAMNNSIERARRQIGDASVCTLQSYLDTFDFEKARTDGLGAGYTDVKDATAKWFKHWRDAAHLQKYFVGDPWSARDRISMTSMNQVYEAQHQDRPLKFIRQVLEVEAFSLMPEEDHRFGWADQVRQTAEFYAADLPVDCYKTFVSSASATGFVPDCAVTIRGPQMETYKHILVPVAETEAGSAHGRSLLIFFNPPLPPRSGPYTVILEDQIMAGMKPLRDKGVDTNALTARRAIAGPFPGDIVLHVPRMFGTVTASAPSGNALAPSDLQRYGSPVNFYAVGWRGEFRARGDRLEVQFQRQPVMQNP